MLKSRINKKIVLLNFTDFTILRRALLLAGCVPFIFLLYASSASNARAEAGSNSNEADAPLCRFGVNSVHGGGESIAGFDISALRLGWYSDYRASLAPAHPSGVEYAPMIRLAEVNVVGTTGVTTYTTIPSGQGLLDAIAANPGADWFIGNEPDRKFWQDDISPRMYAIAFHELSAKIKQVDPLAHIFAGSIVQPTPLRLQYLDLILKNHLEIYGSSMNVDGWAIHNFILNEASCEYFDDDQCWGADIPPGVDAKEGLRVEVKDNDSMQLFVEQIERFRKWMRDRGYANKPLYLSEYGVLMPNIFVAPEDFPPSRVNRFMNATFDYLLSASNASYGDPADNFKLIQRFSWYSTSDKAYNGYLFEKPQADSPYQFSEMGTNYYSYTQHVAAALDLLPVQISADPAAPLVSNGATTITLKAEIGNAGNLQQLQTVKVSFYDGDPDHADPNQKGKLLGTRQVSISGCGDKAIATMVWKNVAPSEYKIFVKVDESNLVDEINEDNNKLEQTIFFATDQIFLPIVSRGF